jgi:hypothetical protein
MRPRFVPSCLFIAVALIMGPTSLHAQSMRTTLDRLFVFGAGEDPLFLAGSAGEPATEVHGDHFIPAEIAANAALLEFFTNAISTNVASFPLSSAVASQTFTFVGGVPTPSSTSFGPIFAERAQTIGRGRLSAGVNYSRLRFARIRGVDLEDVRLTFLHANVDFPGCDAAFGGDCTLFGVPQFENDEIELTLNLDMEAEVLAFYTTFGVTDWLDLGLAVPVIDFELDGSSVARITPTTGDQAFHFFGGTPENPVLEATSISRGQTTGIGDIAMRLKARLVQGENWQLGTLAEARAPTGREEDFLGTGEWNAKGLLIISGTVDDFSPHLNTGFEYRGSQLDQNEVEVVAGFDHRLADWATLAVDLLGAFKVGGERLTLPEPARIEAPFPRTVPRTNIPNRRDDLLDGSIGFKFQTAGGLILITNVLVPLNHGGLRSSPIPTLGVEYSL